MLWLVLVGCFPKLEPERDLVVRDLNLPQAEHAVAMSVGRFAHGVVLEGGSDCNELHRASLRYASIDLTLDQLTAGKETVVALHEGVIDEAHLRGGKVVPLFDKLLSWAEEHRDVASRCGTPPFQGELLLGVDPSVPWETLDAVLITATLARFGRVALRVDDADPEPQGTFPRWTGLFSRVSLGSEAADLTWGRFPRPDWKRVPVDGIGEALGTGGSVVITPVAGLSSGQVVDAVDQVADANDAWWVGTPIRSTARPVKGRQEVLGWRTLDEQAAVAVLPLSHAWSLEASAPRLRFPTAQASFGPLRPSDAAMEEVVEGYQTQLLTCYRRELMNGQDLEGDVLVTFEVAEDGSVRHAALSEDLPSTAVRNCICGRFMRMVFAPSDTAHSHVYTMRFATE